MDKHEELIEQANVDTHTHTLDDGLYRIVTIQSDNDGQEHYCGELYHRFNK